MKNSHLSLEDRKKIQEGLENELTRTAIAKNINKNISTVAKEIKLRRKIKPINPFNNPTIPTTQMDTVYNHSDGSFIQTYVRDIPPNKNLLNI